jgi:hypothetical protein
MEPLDENGLKQLLRKWEAPPAPATLKERLFPQKSWWRWLFTGSIRVPVPVALGVVVLLALWIQLSRPAYTPSVAQPGTLSLADFQPVRQLQPVVVVGGQK